jgi:hypothetical protein
MGPLTTNESLRAGSQEIIVSRGVTHSDSTMQTAAKPFN